MKVAILRSDTTDYPPISPFHPPVQYPELIRLGITEVHADNHVYRAVRQALSMLGLDASRFASPHWNPLARYIQPGDSVLIKPNFVLHEFGAFEGTHCLTAHGSVLRTVVDYAFLAGGRESSIMIADAPIQGADFDRVVENAGIPAIQEYYWQKFRYEIKVQDLRQVRAVINDQSSLIRQVQKLPGDSKGYSVIDLGTESRLAEIDRPGTRYVVGDYDAEVTNTRHRRQHHEYVISNSVLDANVIISLPKLKTHSKTGVTVALKNLVGIIGSKDCLPHHRHGKTNHGGDEFPSDYPLTWYLSARLYAYLQGKVPVPVWRGMRQAARTVFGVGTPMDGSDRSLKTKFFPSGGWKGNDTIWRTVDDLNRILFFYDRSTGRLAAEPQRRYFALVDGIIAMEGNGPLRGVPKPCGVIMAGDDPLALDVVAASLMGFDWRKIRLLKGAADYSGQKRYSAFSGDESDIAVISNVPQWTSVTALKSAHLGFVPPAGWRDHVEVNRVG